MNSNTIITLWAPPRSRSTVFERMIIERGDFFVIHEPFCTIYDTGKLIIKPHLKNTEIKFNSYEGFIDWVIEYSKKQPIFIKETCEYYYSDVLQHIKFLKYSKHAFIIRDLKETIASHYKMNQKLTIKEVGFEYLYKLKTILDTYELPYLIINSQKLIEKPETTIREFCEFNAIKYKPEALKWKAKKIDLWNRTRSWHKKVEKSISFNSDKPVYTNTVDNNSYLKELYDYNIRFYQHFIHQKPLNYDS